MAFEPIKRLAKNFRNLDLDRIVSVILQDKEVQNFIIELNTQGQLFEGIDSLGVSLKSIGGSYAPFTIEEKKKKGQPTDRVTLFSTGKFYKTFEVNVFSKSFEIEADTIKGGEDLQDSWGDDLVGLTKESRVLLVQRIRLLIIDEIRRQIKR